MVKFFIVRHGYSLGNEQGLITGHYDCDLAEYGVKQAKLLCEYMLENIKVDKIYSSPLCRAVNTIKPVADALDLPIIQDESFIELSVGEWEGILYEDVAKLYPKEFTAWINKEEGAGPIGGETWETVYDRASEKIKKLATEEEGKNIIICSHGGVIKALNCFFAGMKTTEMNDLDWASNASITEVWYDDGKFTIKRFSFDDYLGEIKTALPKTV